MLACMQETFQWQAVVCCEIGRNWKVKEKEGNANWAFSGGFPNILHFSRFFFSFYNRRLRQNLHFILLFKDPSKCGRFSFFLHSANHNSEFALLSTDCLCLCASWRHLHHHQSSAIIKMQWALWWWRMEMNMVGDAFRSFPHFKASLRTRALLRSLGIARAHLTKVRHIFPLSTFPHPLHSIVLSLHSILLLFYL